MIYPDLVQSDGNGTMSCVPRSGPDIEGALPMCNRYAMTLTRTKCAVLFSDLRTAARLDADGREARIGDLK